MTLPSGWVETTLGECQGKTETVDPRRTPEVDYDLFSVPSYSAYQPEQTRGAEIGSTKQKVLPNDVLLCKIVPHIRRGWVVPPKCGDRPQIASGEWIVFRDSALEPEFLRRFVLSDAFHAQFMLTVSGVGGSLMRARPAEAAKIVVPVPPIAEQRRIVAKVDALIWRLVRARMELDRVATLARHLRSETLSRCFSKDVTAILLGDLLGRIEAGKNLRCEERPPHAGERGVVKVSAVTWGRFDPLQSKTLPNDYNPPSAAKIGAGDLLISRANTLELVGATVLVEEEPSDLYLSDKILRLVMPDAHKRWVMWFLRSEAGRREIEQRATGNQLSMRNISQGALRAIPIPYPDAQIRKEGVKMIEAAFARADRLEAEATRARALLDRLEAAILAKAFRGELMPQDPNDEPASVLLDRIRAERAAAPEPKRGRARKAVG